MINLLMMLLVYHMLALLFITGLRLWWWGCWRCAACLTALFHYAHNSWGILRYFLNKMLNMMKSVNAWPPSRQYASSAVRLSRHIDIGRALLFCLLLLIPRFMHFLDFISYYANARAWRCYLAFSLFLRLSSTAAERPNNTLFASLYVPIDFFY